MLLIFLIAAGKQQEQLLFQKSDDFLNHPEKGGEINQRYCLEAWTKIHNSEAVS